MRYEVLYTQQIAGKIYKKGEIIEFPNGTDKNFIARLVSINSIALKAEEVVNEEVAEEVAEETNEVAKQERKKNVAKWYK